MKKILFPILIAITLLFSSCSITDPQTPTETTTEHTLSSVIICETQLYEGDKTETTPQTEETTTAETEAYVPPETSVVYSLPVLSPSADYPQNAPLPTLSITGEREVAAFHILPNGDVWLMYTVRPFTLTIINELCTTANNGVTWNKISHAWNGFPVDMFVIDEDHVLVLTDTLYMGYGFYFLENNGMDIAAQYTSSKTLKTANEPDCDFLFPTEYFNEGNESDTDLSFYRSVSAYYVEPIDDSSCKIVLECNVNGETVTRTAIYDANGVHPE